jgi:hypothetical protein
MRRRLWVLLIALLLVAVAGDFFVWRGAVQRMQSGLADWIAANRADGWSISTAPPEAGGWPLAATLTLRTVAVQGGAADIPDGLDWRAERVVLRLGLRHPLELRVDAEGAQRLRVSDAPDIAYTAGDLHLLVPLQSDSSSQPLDLHGEALRAQIPVAGADDTLTLDRLELDAVVHPGAPQGQPALSVALAADGVTLPSRVKWALGGRIASVALDAALNGPLPDVVGVTAAATKWRDDGGSLEVQRLQTQWGKLGLMATATLALDPELQPMGTGTAHVTGYAETLDALARNGLMSRSAATTAKAVLSLLADTPDNGSPSEVEVPLSLQYRTLSMRQVPLVRLPELDWPPP